MCQEAEEELLVRMEYAGLKRCLIQDKAVKSVISSQKSLQFGPQGGSQKALESPEGLPGSHQKEALLWCFTSPREERGQC